MINYWDYANSYEAPVVVGGTASVLYDIPEQDIIERLHQCIEEVIGKPVVIPKIKMGFI